MQGSRQRSRVSSEKGSGIPLHDHDVCAEEISLGKHCHLLSLISRTKSRLVVDSNYFPYLSQVSVDIKWEFVDGNGGKIVCILFPAKIATFPNAI